MKQELSVITRHIDQLETRRIAAEITKSLANQVLSLIDERESLKRKRDEPEEPKGKKKAKKCGVEQVEVSEVPVYPLLKQGKKVIN
jgi:hypothetical protein